MSNYVYRVNQSYGYVWSIPLLTWVPAQQAVLDGGSVTLSAAVNQGTGGSSAWLVNEKVALTASAPTTTTVGVGSAQAVAANSSRKGLELRNLSSTETISLGFGVAAVLNSGVTLRPYDVYHMDNYDFNVSAVNAIASASAPLSVQEFA